MNQHMGFCKALPVYKSFLIHICLLHVPWKNENKPGEIIWKITDFDSRIWLETSE